MEEKVKKVLAGLDACVKILDLGGQACKDCPYRLCEDSCENSMMIDAAEVIRAANGEV